MIGKKIYKIAKNIIPRMSKNKIIKLFEDKGFDIKYLGRGKYKRAFKIKLNKRYYALKMGNNIPIEYENYKKVRKLANKRLFTIYWSFDYICLQRYGHKSTHFQDKNYKECKKVLKPICTDYRPKNCAYANDGLVKCYDIGSLK